MTEGRLKTSKISASSDSAIVVSGNTLSIAEAAITAFLLGFAEVVEVVFCAPAE